MKVSFYNFTCTCTIWHWGGSHNNRHVSLLLGLQFVETQLDIWNMDTFHLHKLSDGNPLVTAAYTVFKKRNLISEFKISPPTFINFMTAVQVHARLQPPPLPSLKIASS